MLNFKKSGKINCLTSKAIRNPFLNSGMAHVRSLNYADGFHRPFFCPKTPGQAGLPNLCSLIVGFIEAIAFTIQVFRIDVVTEIFFHCFECNG